MTPAQWFDHIYRYVDAGWISLFTFDRQAGDKRVEWAKIGETDALTMSDDRCIWFGVATRRANLGPVRGGTADCAQIPALWVDIDVAGDAHAQSELPPDMASALQLLDDYPVEPTCVIRTGNGLQAWWQFAEPLEVDEAVPLLARWGTTWTQLANRRGWHIDNVWDVARVMRVPGTYNTKTNARPLVTVERADWSRTFCVDDFEAHLLEAPPQTRPTRNGLPYVGPQRPGDAYNAVTDPGDLLNAVGCHFDKQDANGDRHWRAPHHPGANEGSGITVYADHTTIYSQTFARTYGLETGRPYDPFALYTFLFHGGVWAEASAALRARGFGSDEFQTTEETVTNEDEWPEPIPLVDDAEVPDFPIHTLPRWIVDQCRNVERNIQVVVDLPVSLAIGALSVATVGKLKVRYPRKNWTQPTNLYMVTAMPPSSGKSPAKSAMFGVLEELESASMQEASKDVAEYETVRRMMEREQRAAEETYAKTGDPERQMRAIDLSADLALQKRPSNGRIMVDDVTTEALGIEMRDAGGAIALVTAEGGIFDRIAGMYTEQVANLDIYLESWGGGRYSVSRVKREGILMKEGNLALIATIQPSTLEAIGKNPAFRGRGLTARLMLSVPRTNVGDRDRMSISVHDSAAEAAWKAQITEIHQWVRETAVESGGWTTLVVSDEAGLVFAPWDQDYERRLKTDELSHMVEWIGKLRADVLRIAALLHLAEGHRDTPIGVDTMERAIEIGEYYVAHAKAVMGSWGTDARIMQAREVLAWVRREGRADVSVRDLYRGMRRLFPDAEATRAPLDILVERGWLRPLFEGPMVIGRGGKSSPRFAVHPQMVDPKSRDTRDTGATGPSEPTCVPSVPPVSQPENAKKPFVERPVAPVAPVAHKGDFEDSSFISREHSAPVPPDTRDTGATGIHALPEKYRDVEPRIAVNDLI